MRRGFHYKLLSPYRITKDRDLNLDVDPRSPADSESDADDIGKGKHFEHESLASVSLEDVRLSEDTMNDSMPMTVLPDGQSSFV